MQARALGIQRGLCECRDLSGAEDAPFSGPPDLRLSQPSSEMVPEPWERAMSR